MFDIVMKREIEKRGSNVREPKSIPTPPPAPSTQPNNNN